MYLHIGNGEIVVKEEIIGIFDMDTATVSAQTKKFLAKAEQKNEIRYSDSDIPKSFIICLEKDHSQKILFSRISASALKFRKDIFLTE